VVAFEIQIEQLSKISLSASITVSVMNALKIFTSWQQCYRRQSRWCFFTISREVFVGCGTM